MRRRFLINRLISVVVLAALILAALAYHFHHNSDALWQIISRQCIPNQQQRQDPAPCESVDLAQHYVLFKDKIGALQYLLMPTDKVSGIESPALLAQSSPDYFFLAWSHLNLLSKKFNKTIPATYLSLAINSQSGRTQNQLHIHMSCLRPDVKQQLAVLQNSLTATWQRVILLQHSYWIRTLEPDQLSHPSLVKRIALERADFNLAKGAAGIALAQLPDGRLVVMVLRTDRIKGILGSAEELQDHRCQLLGGNIAA